MGISSQTGHFYLFISSGLYRQASCYACLTQTTAYRLAVKAAATNLGLKTPPQTSNCKTKPEALHSHFEYVSNCIYETSLFCPVVLIKDLNAFPCQKETRRFRQSGAAAEGLKINSAEVNGKANTSGWQKGGSGSAQHDTISKLSFSPLWPSHLSLTPTLLQRRPSTHSKTESSDLTSWTLLPRTITLSALHLGGARQRLPPDFAAVC